MGRGDRDVTCTLVSTTDDRDAAVRFLAASGARENAMLIRDILDSPEARRVVVCHRGPRIAGVASMPHGPDMASDDPWDRPVYMDAVDDESAEALLGVLPTEAALMVWLGRPHLQQYLDGLPAAIRRMHLLCFAVSFEDFRPAPDSQVRPLTAADLHLFAGCARQPSEAFWGPDREIWGLVRDGRVVTSAILRPLVPELAGVTQGVTAICALETETAYRRQGLARGLVSHLTERVLAAGSVPIYSASVDNVPSQGLARGLGYQPYAEEIAYEWRHP